MTIHIHGTILTPDAIASNNRGENEGNSTTLHKVTCPDGSYSMVSSDAIRYALRVGLITLAEVNRKIQDGGSIWADPAFLEGENRYADDDILGYMNAKAKDDDSGGTKKRRGRLAMTHALSIRPWTGDSLHNFASVGAQSQGGKKGPNDNPIPFASEIHKTRYKFVFTFTPSELAKKSNAAIVLDCFMNLTQVGGNHSRCLYDFSPEALVLRISPDPVPRLFTCFGENVTGQLNIDGLLFNLRNGDLKGQELVVGGAPLLPFKTEIENLGATFVPGVKGVFNLVKQRMEPLL